MRHRRKPIVVMIVLGLLQGGCIDAVRTGLTGGVSSGLKGAISNVVEDIVAGLADPKK